MPVYAARYHDTDLVPAMVYAPDIHEALTLARRSGVLPDGRKIADMSDAALDGNLSVAPRYGELLYYRASSS